MKTLTPSQRSAMEAGGKDLFRFVRFDWPDGSTRYYSERAAQDWSPDPGKTFEPLLASFPMTSRRVGLGLSETMPSQVSDFSVLIAPSAGDAAVDAMASAQAPIGCAVTTYQALRPAEGDLAESDWIVLGRFFVTHYEALYDAPARVAFKCVDFTQRLGERLIGRVFLANDYPWAPTRTYGRMIPHVFGALKDCPCEMVRGAGLRRTTLSEAIGADDLYIAVAGASRLDSAGGVALIENERVAYTGYSGNVLAVESAGGRGAQGSEACAHAYGAPVVQATDYTFAVADHAIASVGKLDNVCVNGIPIDPSLCGELYTDANGVAVFDLERLPDAAEPMRTPEDDCVLTANVIGLVGSSGCSISGRQTIERLLSDSRYMALEPGDYDAESLAAATADAESDLSEGQWLFARRIDRRVSARHLLPEAVTEAGIRMGLDGGRLIFYPRLLAEESESGRTISRELLLSAPARESVRIELIWNEIAVSYARELGSDGGTLAGGPVVASSAASQSRPWGAQGKALSAEWIRSEPIARALAERLCGDFAMGRFLTQVTAFSGRTLDLEVGDAVAIEDEYAGLDGRAGRIVGAAYPASARHRLTVAHPLIDARTRVWEHTASGSYIDVRESAGQMRFVVDGTLVAILSSTGLRIAGELQELAFDPQIVASKLIEYRTGSPNAISLSIGDSESCFAGLWLTAAGDLRVAEGCELADAFPAATLHVWNDWIEWDDAGADAVATADYASEYLRLAAALVAGNVNGILQVGGIVEQAPLI